MTDGTRTGRVVAIPITTADSVTLSVRWDEPEQCVHEDCAYHPLSHYTIRGGADAEIRVVE